MYIHKTKTRVLYADTDQMGYVYYGNYARYYEIGRVEAMRNLVRLFFMKKDTGERILAPEIIIEKLKSHFET